MFMGNVKKRFSKKNHLLSNLAGEGLINNSHDLPLIVHYKMGSVFCVTDRSTRRVRYSLVTRCELLTDRINEMC